MLKLWTTLFSTFEVLDANASKPIEYIGAARVGEHRERSLPEIGKLYRNDNRFIDRSWKMYVFPTYGIV